MEHPVFTVPLKSEQLQIRVTSRQKAELKRRAKAAGVDVSTYVLATVLPSSRERFAEHLQALRDDGTRRFALATLNDFLTDIASVEFGTAVAVASIEALPPLMQNYVAAMVELAAERRGLAPPAWVRDVLPLESPWFAASLKSLRAYLLQVSPVPFKRRNLFVDATVGARA